MATLPVYDSQRNIQAGQAKPFVKDRPAITGAREAGENQRQVIGAVQEAAQKWSDANDVMQYTKATSDYDVLSGEIKNRAANDPDFSPESRDKYAQELQEAKSQSILGIDNAQVAQKASFEMDLNNNLSMLKIDFANKNKQMEANKLNLQNVITSQTNDMNGVSDNQRLQIQQSIDEKLAINVGMGIITQAEADEIVYDSKTANATARVFSDPDGLINDLKDKDGFYKEIPVEKRLKLKEIKELQKEIVYSTETDVAMKIAQGETVNIETLSNMVEAGTMSSDFAQITLRVLTSPDSVGAYTNNDEFAALTKQIFKSGNKEQVRKAINNILKGGGDGKLSKDDLQILVQSAVNAPIEKRKEQTGAVDTLGKWVDETEGADRADVFRDFQEKLAEGKDLSVAVNETMRENTVKSVPKVLAFPKEGKLQIDKYGNKAIVFPDGRIEEVK
jgi:hypothetical protein